MELLIAENTVSLANADTAPTSGTPGYATDGNPASNIPATQAPAWHYNMMMAELVGVVTAAGLTPSGTNWAQLTQAINILLGASTTPAGTVIMSASSTAPTGYIAANGAAISRTTYANLFAAIGTTFGVGDGSTTFNLPDLRGEFLRGFDNGRGVDPSRTFGSTQANAVQSHNHGVTDPTHSHTAVDSGHVHIVDIPGGSATTPGSGSTNVALSGSGNTSVGYANITVAAASTGISIQAYGSTETRPTNVALLACIKY